MATSNERSLDHIKRDTAATRAVLQELGNRGEHCLRQLVTLQRMPEIQDGRLVGNRIAAKLQNYEHAHQADVVKCFLRSWIREALPLLQAINPQHQG